MFTLRLNYRLQIYTLLYTRVETTRVTSQHWNTLSDNISALKHEYFFSHPEAALTTSVPLPSEQSSTPQKEPRENSGSGFCSPPPSPHLLREAARGAAHPPLTLPTIPTRIPRRRGRAGYRPPPHESRLEQPPHRLHARKETPLISPPPALHSAARLNLTRTACRCTAQSPPRLQRDGATATDSARAREDASLPLLGRSRGHPLATPPRHVAGSGPSDWRRRHSRPLPRSRGRWLAGARRWWAAMEDGESASPPGADGGEEEDDFGYRLFPDRKKEPQSFLVRSLFTFHNRCQLMLRMTLETSKLSPGSRGLQPPRRAARRQVPGAAPLESCGGRMGPRQPRGLGVHV